MGYYEQIQENFQSAKNRNFKQHACQNTIATETLNSLNKGRSYQIIVQINFRKTQEVGWRLLTLYATCCSCADEKVSVGTF